MLQCEILYLQKLTKTPSPFHCNLSILPQDYNPNWPFLFGCFQRPQVFVAQQCFMCLWCTIVVHVFDLHLHLVQVLHFGQCGSDFKKDI